MEEITLEPGWYYYIAFFAIIIAWTLIGYGITQNMLVTMLLDPSLWILNIAILVTSLPIPIGIVVWRLKDDIGTVNPEWNYVNRDVEMQEYSRMVNDYNSAYPFLMAKTHFERLLMVLLSGMLCVFFPLVLSFISIDALFVSPHLEGGLLVIYGIFLISFLAAAIPGPISHEFPFQKTSIWPKAIAELIQIPAIYWIGIRLKIGEWKGYFTLREPHLVARIEGIQSIFALSFDVNDKGRIVALSVVNESNNEKLSSISPIIDPSLDAIKSTIKKCLLLYREASEEKGFLDDIINELDSE